MVAQLVPAPHPILAAVTGAREAIAGVREAQPVFMIPAEQEAAISAITALKAVLAELECRVLAVAGEAASEAGARDIGGWSAHVSRTDAAAARADAKLAVALDRRWQRVAAGMAEGIVNRDQARVLVECLEALPGDLDPELRARAEEHMVGLCARFRPEQLRRLGRHLLEVVAPQIAEAELAQQLEREEAQARERTGVRVRRLGQGLCRTTITHPEADQDRLLTYLDA